MADFNPYEQISPWRAEEFGILLHRNRLASEGIRTRNGYRIQLGEYIQLPYLENGAKTSMGSQLGGMLRLLTDETSGNPIETHVPYLTRFAGINGPWLLGGENTFYLREQCIQIVKDPSAALNYTKHDRGPDGRFQSAFRPIEDGGFPGGIYTHITRKLNHGANPFVPKPQMYTQHLIADNGIGFQVAHVFVSDLQNDAFSEPGQAVTIQGVNWETVKAAANLVEAVGDKTPQASVASLEYSIDGLPTLGVMNPKQLKTTFTLRTQQPPETVPDQSQYKDELGDFRLYESNNADQVLADIMNREAVDLSHKPMADEQGRGLTTLHYFAGQPCWDKDTETNGDALTPSQQYHNAIATTLNWMNWAHKQGIKVEEVTIVKAEDQYFDAIPEGAAHQGAGPWPFWRIHVRFSNAPAAFRPSGAARDAERMEEVTDDGTQWRQRQYQHLSSHVRRQRIMREPALVGATTTDGLGVFYIDCILPVPGTSVIVRDRDNDATLVNRMIRFPNQRILQLGFTCQLPRGPLFGNEQSPSHRLHLAGIFIDEEVQKGIKPPDNHIEFRFADFAQGKIDPSQTICIDRYGKESPQAGCFNIDEVLDRIVSTARDRGIRIREQGREAERGFYNEDGVGFCGLNRVFAAEVEGIPGMFQELAFVLSVVNSFQRHPEKGFINCKFDTGWSDHWLAQGTGISESVEQTFRFRFISEIFHRDPVEFRERSLVEYKERKEKGEPEFSFPQRPASSAIWEGFGASEELRRIFGK